MANATTKSKKRMRAYGEAREVRDQEWLRLNQEGKPASAIAEDAGVSVQLVRRALARAREQADSREQDAEQNIPNPPEGAEGSTGEGSPPEAPAARRPWWLELVPLFPIGSFTPASECPHRGPIQPGSLLCCMVCSASGVDEHPYLVRDPETDPKPEPKSRRIPTERSRGAETTAPARETRRQKRARRFGGASASAAAG